MRRYIVRIGRIAAALVAGVLLFDGIIPFLSGQIADWDTRRAAMSDADWSIDCLTITGEPALRAGDTTFPFGPAQGPMFLKPGVEFRDTCDSLPALVVRNRLAISEILCCLRTATRPIGPQADWNYPVVQIYRRGATPEETPDRIQYSGGLFGDSQGIDRAVFTSVKL